MAFEVIQHAVRLAHPEYDEAEAEAFVKEAAMNVRARHSDFDHFLPAMDVLSRYLYGNLEHLTLEQMIETLYATVKHAPFAKAWREELRQKVAAAAPAVQ
jgi:hypothetical protein